MEPVAEWQASSLLALQYADPRRWSFTAQTMIAASLAERAVSADATADATDTSVLVLERSARGNALFADQARALGWMTEPEHALYGRVAKLLAAPVDLYVWLDTSPALCAERIRGRARAEDGTLDPDWLAAVHSRHQREFGRAEQRDTLVLDGALPPEALAGALWAEIEKRLAQ